MLLGVLPLLITSSWTSFYAHGRDGEGPLNVTFQLASRPHSGYRVSVFEMEDPPVLVSSKAFPDQVRFHRLTVHWNPENDLWQEKGEWIKQFPRLLFVGEGWREGKPVTYVWRLARNRQRTPVLLLKAFASDHRRLDENRVRSANGSLLIERARVGWLPIEDRPKGAKPARRVRRVWRFDAKQDRFSAGPWRSTL